ncbi:MAG: HAD family phosphatase [Chlamydiia bacterium]|nr:HAD family phosphatase [Chlamydiia bacterium]
MHWIQNFQLFLFDFDGLLVDTEKLHYRAYQELMARQGFCLDWDFTTYCRLAHWDATAIRQGLYAKFPDLNPDWKSLYEEKKKIYKELILGGRIQLMPGVERLLTALQKANIRRCTVTNSSLEQTQLVRAQLQVLNTIPYWVTREQYEKPKPSPECYLYAIRQYASAGDRIIGFEDSIRGLLALQGTPALAVLICPKNHPLVNQEEIGGALHVTSFDEILDRELL